MTSIGPNTPHAAGCGGASGSLPGLPGPRTRGGGTSVAALAAQAAQAQATLEQLTGGGSYASMTTAGGYTDPPAFAMPTPERFASTQAGGVIVGADGKPAGSIPAGAFVDTKDGSVYSADGKPITLPTGATVDFFDLPDLDQLVAMAKGSSNGAAAPAATGGGKADHASFLPPMKSAVDGQWGPGGTTPIKGGSTPSVAQDDCGMEHGATVAKAGSGTAVAGASGTGPATKAGILASYAPSTSTAGGGLTTSVAGASSLGTTPTLESSLAELIATLKELSLALAKSTSATGGGAPTAPPADPLQNGHQRPPRPAFDQRPIDFTHQRPPLKPVDPVAPPVAPPTTTSTTGSGSSTTSGDGTTTTSTTTTTGGGAAGTD